MKEHRKITHDFDNKMVLIPHKAKAFRILGAMWFDRDKFSDKRPKEQIENNLLCLSLYGKSYLFLYLKDGGIKIEEAEIYDYDLVLDRVKQSESPKIFGENQKTLMCKALGYQKGGWDTASQIQWL